MQIQEQHYDVKLKLNAVDSNKYSKFTIPEIDWFLNEAKRVWVKSIAFPRYESPVNFEMNTRTINDIYKIVHNDAEFKSSNLTKFDDLSYIYNIENLDPEFWFFLSGYAQGSKGNCTANDLVLFDEQHDDLHENNTFSKSSFEWREVNIRHIDKGLRLFTDGFDITGVKINYVKKLKYMHNAQDYSSQGYEKLADGTMLTGRVHSEFSYSREISAEINDIAVLLITNAVSPQYNVKANKLDIVDKRV